MTRFFLIVIMIIQILTRIIGAVILVYVGIFVAILVGQIVKIAIYTLAGFMILFQLELAQNIVTIAFVVTLGAIAVAFALAFDLGGKDFAKKTLDKVDEKIEKMDDNK